MRRAGSNALGATSSDPHGLCHTSLFGSDGADNGDGTCTYGNRITCAYGDMPNKDASACTLDRCTTAHRLTRAGLATGAAALAGYGASRAFFPAHPVRGTLVGAVLGAAAYGFYDFTNCIFGGGS